MTWRSFWKRFGSGEKPHVMIVEVEKPRPVPTANRDIAASLSTLQGHPGFQWLLSRLRLQRELLRSSLSTQRQKSLTDVEFLQSGVAWTGWLEEQWKRAMNWEEPRPQLTPLDEERAAFEEISRAIEVLR